MAQGETVLVTGAGGRIGRLLQAVWGGETPENRAILWFGRGSLMPPYRGWDIGHNPPPEMAVGSVVLHLAGKISGTPQELAENERMTRDVCMAARAAGARHVVVMSTAAVYAPGPVALGEGEVPAPASAYGASKLAAERVAAQVLRGSATGLTVLRLANLAGADGLLGGAVPGRVVMLDPVPGQAGGPERSYIGPRVLADVLAAVLRRAFDGSVSGVVNVAQQPPVAMADLLDAGGLAWQFGPPRAGVVARVVLATDRLAALTDLPQTSPAALIAEMTSIPGWPR